MAYAAAVVQSMRPPFLLLTPICVFLGLAVAINLQGHINVLNAVLVVIAATCAHISVNTFNEYFDYRSGLDALTTKTPFSGGSGSLPSEPNALTAVLYAALVTLAITTVIGLYLAFRSPALLPLGLLGVALIVLYTTHINRAPILCLIAPGLAFGPLFVVGTYLSVVDNSAVNSHGIFVAFLASLVPFFLVNNLLLLSQIPDIDADRQVGRNTFPIKFGTAKSLQAYLAFIVLSAVPIALGVVLQIFHWPTLIGALPLVLGFMALEDMKASNSEIDKMIPGLGKNVACILLTILVYASLIVVTSRFFG